MAFGGASSLLFVYLLDYAQLGWIMMPNLQRKEKRGNLMGFLMFTRKHGNMMVLLVSIAGLALPAWELSSIVACTLGCMILSSLFFCWETFRYDIAFLVLMEPAYWVVESFSGNNFTTFLLFLWPTFILEDN